MTIRTLYVTAPDGVRLATDVCLPRSSGPHPTVVIRTPYGRTAHRAELRGWAAHGFAAVAQDVRGRHGSEGKWHPYRSHEEEDGAATMSWVRGHVWSNGRVVAAGASYAAYCALVTAVTGDGGDGGDGTPDAVIAAVPALSLAETAREATGPERLRARAGWWTAHGDRPDSDPDALETALARDPRLLEHLPVSGLGNRLDRELPSWTRVWDDCRRGRLVLHGAAARMPLLAVGGTRDPFAEDTVALWRGWGGPSRLLLGPWGHRLTAGEEPAAHGRINLGTLYVRWSKAALAGRLEHTRRGVIALGGSGRWYRAPGPDDGPCPETADAVRRQVLTGTGRPGTDRTTPPSPPPSRTAQCARGEGTAPSGIRGAASTRPTVWAFGTPTGLRLLHGADFTADPAQPVRSDDLVVPAGGDGADRCVLLSRPLARPLDLAGHAEARIRGVTDGPCADWAVRVTALDPSGRAEPLAFGIVRRTDPPGDAVGITVPLGTLGRRLDAGTRLRVEIAGHHFPAHARNPHTGENPVTATRLTPSRRTVLTGGSALVLPVTARRRYVEPVPEICR
ncbi:CocE/NonD family hydrolase [Streptomyces sp. NPDC056835]|uniref:CocE/NonD family hydrolase n=1 Tax=Streptomyces sp. NPDC056835 TaxID=3345956 RepID=UPI0036B90C0E